MLIVGIFLWRLANIIKNANWRAILTVQPVFLDGALWVIIAMGQAAIGRLGSEDAYKYIDPILLYWVKFGVEIVTQGATGLKMFRSTSYSKHVDDVQALKDAAPGSPSTEATKTVSHDATSTTTVETSKTAVIPPPQPHDNGQV